MDEVVAKEDNCIMCLGLECFDANAMDWLIDDYPFFNVTYHFPWPKGKSFGLENEKRNDELSLCV